MSISKNNKDNIENVKLYARELYGEAEDTSTLFLSTMTGNIIEYGHADDIQKNIYWRGNLVSDKRSMHVADENAPYPDENVQEVVTSVHHVNLMNPKNEDLSMYGLTIQNEKQGKTVAVTDELIGKVVRMKDSDNHFVSGTVTKKEDGKYALNVFKIHLFKKGKLSEVLKPVFTLEETNDDQKEIQFPMENNDNLLRYMQKEGKTFITPIGILEKMEESRYLEKSDLIPTFIKKTSREGKEVKISFTPDELKGKYLYFDNPSIEEAHHGQAYILRIPDTEKTPFCGLSSEGTSLIMHEELFGGGDVTTNIFDKLDESMKKKIRDEVKKAIEGSFEPFVQKYFSDKTVEERQKLQVKYALKSHLYFNLAKECHKKEDELHKMIQSDLSKMTNYIDVIENKIYFFTEAEKELEKSCKDSRIDCDKDKLSKRKIKLKKIMQTIHDSEKIKLIELFQNDRIDIQKKQNELETYNNNNKVSVTPLFGNLKKYFAHLSHMEEKNDEIGMRIIEEQIEPLVQTLPTYPIDNKTNELIPVADFVSYESNGDSKYHLEEKKDWGNVPPSIQINNVIQKVESIKSKNFSHNLTEQIISKLRTERDYFKNDDGDIAVEDLIAQKNKDEKLRKIEVEKEQKNILIQEIIDLQNKNRKRKDTLIWYFDHQLKQRNDDESTKNLEFNISGEIYEGLVMTRQVIIKQHVEVLHTPMERALQSTNKFRLLHSAKSETSFEKRFTDVYNAIEAKRAGTRILRTPNNPVSSRGHLCLSFKVKFNNQKEGTWHICDFAGSENPIKIAEQSFNLPQEYSSWPDFLRQQAIRTFSNQTDDCVDKQNLIKKLHKMRKTKGSMEDTALLWKVILQGFFINESNHHLMAFARKQDPSTLSYNMEYGPIDLGVRSVIKENVQGKSLFHTEKLNLGDQQQLYSVRAYHEIEKQRARRRSIDLCFNGHGDIHGDIPEAWTTKTGWFYNTEKPFCLVSGSKYVRGGEVFAEIIEDDKNKNLKGYVQYDPKRFAQNPVAYIHDRRTVNLNTKTYEEFLRRAIRRSNIPCVEVAEEYLHPLHGGGQHKLFMSSSSKENIAKAWKNFFVFCDKYSSLVGKEDIEYLNNKGFINKLQERSLVLMHPYSWCGSLMWHHFPARIEKEQKLEFFEEMIQLSEEYKKTIHGQRSLYQIGNRSEMLFRNSDFIEKIVHDTKLFMAYIGPLEKVKFKNKLKENYKYFSAIQSTESHEGNAYWYLKHLNDPENVTRQNNSVFKWCDEKDKTGSCAQPKNKECFATKDEMQDLGFQEYTDETSGKKYFANPTTGESRWTPINDCRMRRSKRILEWLKWIVKEAKYLANMDRRNKRPEEETYKEWKKIYEKYYSKQFLSGGGTVQNRLQGGDDAYEACYMVNCDDIEDQTMKDKCVEHDSYKEDSAACMADIKIMITKYLQSLKKDDLDLLRDEDEYSLLSSLKIQEESDYENQGNMKLYSHASEKLKKWIFENYDEEYDTPLANIFNDNMEALKKIWNEFNYGNNELVKKTQKIANLVLSNDDDELDKMHSILDNFTMDETVDPCHPIKIKAEQFVLLWNTSIKEDSGITNKVMKLNSWYKQASDLLKKEGMACLQHTKEIQIINHIIDMYNFKIKEISTTVEQEVFTFMLDKLKNEIKEMAIEIDKKEILWMKFQYAYLNEDNIQSIHKKVIEEAKSKFLNFGSLDMFDWDQDADFYQFSDDIEWQDEFENWFCNNFDFILQNKIDNASEQYIVDIYTSNEFNCINNTTLKSKIQQKYMLHKFKEWYSTIYPVPSDTLENILEYYTDNNSKFDSYQGIQTEIENERKTFKEEVNKAIQSWQNENCNTKDKIDELRASYEKEPTSIDLREIKRKVLDHLEKQITSIQSHLVNNITGNEICQIDKEEETKLDNDIQLQEEKEKQEDVNEQTKTFVLSKLQETVEQEIPLVEKIKQLELLKTKLSKKEECPSDEICDNIVNNASSLTPVQDAIETMEKQHQQEVKEAEQKRQEEQQQKCKEQVASHTTAANESIQNNKWDEAINFSSIDAECQNLPSFQKYSTNLLQQYNEAKQKEKRTKQVNDLFNEISNKAIEYAKTTAEHRNYSTKMKQLIYMKKEWNKLPTGALKWLNKHPLYQEKQEQNKKNFDEEQKRQKKQQQECDAYEEKIKSEKTAESASKTRNDNIETVCDDENIGIKYGNFIGLIDEIVLNKQVDQTLQELELLKKKWLTFLKTNVDKKIKLNRIEEVQRGIQIIEAYQKENPLKVLKGTRRNKEVELAFHHLKSMYHDKLITMNACVENLHQIRDYLHYKHLMGQMMNDRVEDKWNDITNLAIETWNQWNLSCDKNTINEEPTRGFILMIPLLNSILFPDGKDTNNKMVIIQNIRCEDKSKDTKIETIHEGVKLTLQFSDEINPMSLDSAQKIKCGKLRSQPYSITKCESKKHTLMNVDFNTNKRTNFSSLNAEFVPYFDTIKNKKPIGIKATTEVSGNVIKEYNMNIYKLYAAKYPNGTINPWYWGRIKHNKKDLFVALADSTSSHDPIVNFNVQGPYFGPWVSTWDEINFSVSSEEVSEEEYFSSSKVSTLSGDLLRVEDLATMQSSLTSNTFEEPLLYLKDLVLSDMESDIDDDQITMVMSDSDDDSMY